MQSASQSKPLPTGIAVSTIARNVGLAILIATLNEQTKVVPIIIDVLIVGLVAELPYSLWMRWKVAPAQVESSIDASLS